jgi:U3 small nucleolar RNA-associated protein 20
MSLIQKTVGTTEYVLAYQKVVDHISNVRQERRSTKAIKTVTDPKASMIRRSQKNDMKKNGRKRKAADIMIKKGKRRNIE